MTIRSLIATFTILLAFSACNSQNPGVKSLNPEQFEKGIASSDVQVVDVRTPEEYSEKHITNASNININSADFEKGMSKLNKRMPLYIYCLAGSRSAKAADWSAKNGFKEVYNLDGGINAWIADKKPVVTESGKAPENGMSFDDYLAHIKAADKMVLVDFNAVWCGPCKALKPIVVKVIKKYADKVELFDIDVDHNPSVSQTMNIRNIPLVILYKQGKEVWRNLGLTDEGTITEAVKKFSK